jgi:hypothetical protein
MMRMATMSLKPDLVYDLTLVSDDERLMNVPGLSGLQNRC